MATEHHIKSWPDYFWPIHDGVASFTLRRDDRRYAVGDVLVLMEFDSNKGGYTGRECRRRIRYKLQGGGIGSIAPLHGLAREFCILGLDDGEA